MLEKLLRWLAEIGRPVNSVTKLFFRPRHPASQFTAEQRADGGAEEGAEEAGAVVTPTENGVADLTIAKTFTVPVTADMKVEAGARINSPASTVPDQDEIQRRRDLVRMLFNDFWSGTYEKPAAFVERLNQEFAVYSRGYFRNWQPHPHQRACDRAHSPPSQKQGPLLLDNGVPPHVVAQRCGHDVATLLKNYAKRTKKADTSAIGYWLCVFKRFTCASCRSPR